MVMMNVELLRELVDYNANTGEFTWKTRSPSHFACGKRGQAWRCRRWNNRHAGTPALTAIRQDGYRTGFILSRPVLAHRLAWFIHYGEWPENGIDHINHNRSDNRITNLRDATQAENCKNITIPKNNTSGHVGVHLCKMSGRWVAQIGVGGRKIGIGTFCTIEEAILARKEADEHYGFHKNHGKIDTNNINEGAQS